MRCLYDIEDIRNGQILFKGLTVQGVNKAIGISRNSVYLYAENGLTYKKMYLIHNVGAVKSVDDHLAREWNRTTTTLLAHSDIIRNMLIVPKV